MTEEKNEPVELSAIFGEELTNLDEGDNETTPPVVEPPKDEKKDEPKDESSPKEDEQEVDWKKRYSDTRKALGEATSKSKTLESKMAELEKKLNSHDAELFPEKQGETPKDNPEDVAWQNRVIEAEELTRTVYKDYDEKVGKQGDEDVPFNKAMKENPTLFNRVKAAKNPALEAYNIAKEYEFRQSYGSTPEEIESKIREKILKELATQKETEEKPKLKKTTTLRAVDGATDEPSDASDKLPLTSIFRGR